MRKLITPYLISSNFLSQVNLPSWVLKSESRSPEKVLPLLEALEMAKKNVAYYALDLSFSGLQSALEALPVEKFKFVRVGALYGTFNDGVHWLKETSGVKDLPHTLLLFGLTIGNFSRTDAANFLRDIADGALAANPDESSILLSLDSCKVPTKVLRAYTAEGVCPFALESLEYGNSLFIEKDMSAKPVFQVNDWHFLSEWNYRLGRHEASLITRNHDVRLGAPLDGIVVQKHEKVLFGCSHKYDAEERKELFKSAGLKAVNGWSAKGCDVAFYQLKL